MNIFHLLRNSQKILGINARNLDYIARFNSPQTIRIADNKLTTKTYLKQADLPFPGTLVTISGLEDIDTINWEELPPSFVIKPVSASQGRGVLIVFGKSKKREHTWIKSDGGRITKEEIEIHLSNILAGAFSEEKDFAFFEERVKIHPALKPYARRGTPDIRVVVFNNVPVMAELRLPTMRSGGRSNLHMGGIGVGIDLANGITTHAIYLGKAIRCLPGTRVLLSGVAIPSWTKILLLAVEAQRACGLGFAGIDIGIDRQGNPLIFEVNAQPGLAIQNANLSGLREHLERVKGVNVKSARQGISLAQALFGGDTRRQIEGISGKKIIGPFEIIEVEIPKGLWPTMAKVDTGADSTSVDRALVKKLQIPKEKLERRVVKSALGEETRDVVAISFIMKGERIETEATLSDRSDLRYDILIGRKDLRNFLIDVSIKKPKNI